MNNPTETEAALGALRRAAQTARERAIRFGTKLAIWSEGAVVLIDPEPIQEEEEGATDRLPAGDPEPEDN